VKRITSIFVLASLPALLCAASQPVPAARTAADGASAPAQASSAASSHDRHHRHHRSIQKKEHRQHHRKSATH